MILINIPTPGDEAGLKQLVKSNILDPEASSAS